MKRDRGAAAAEDHPDSRAPVRSGERPMTDQCDLGEGIGGPIHKQFLQTFTIRGERETVRQRETDRERELTQLVPADDTGIRPHSDFFFMG